MLLQPSAVITQVTAKRPLHGVYMPTMCSISRTEFMCLTDELDVALDGSDGEAMTGKVGAITTATGADIESCLGWKEGLEGGEVTFK